jgi:hypothetical protein
MNNKENQHLSVSNHSFIIFDKFNFILYEEHIYKSNMIRVSIEERILDDLNTVMLPIEEWEQYKDNYWSEDRVISDMTIDILKDKYGKK